MGVTVLVLPLALEAREDLGEFLALPDVDESFSDLSAPFSSSVIMFSSVSFSASSFFTSSSSDPLSLAFNLSSSFVSSLLSILTIS